MNQKGSIGVIILIILLFVVGIGGAYYLGAVKNKVQTQTQQANVPVSSRYPQTTVNSTIPQPSPSLLPDPAANWQVYTDSKVGISFKYPANSKITKEDNPTYQYIRIQNYPDNPPKMVLDPGTYYLEIGIYDKHLGRKITNSCADQESNYKITDGSIYIGDEKDTQEAGGVVKMICFQNSNFDFTMTGTENNPQTPLVNSIFNSFKLSN